MKDFLTLLLGLFLVLAGFKLSNSASSGIMTVLPVILIAAGIAVLAFLCIGRLRRQRQNPKK
jgi:hypothetical protein